MPPPPVATGGAWSTRPGRGGRQWVTIGGRQVLRGQPRGPGLGRYALRRLADRLHPEWASLNERLPNGGHPFGGGWVGTEMPLRFLPSGEEEGWAPARAAVAAEAGGPRVRLRGPPSWRGGGPGQRHRGGEPPLLDRGRPVPPVGPQQIILYASRDPTSPDDDSRRSIPYRIEDGSGAK